MSEQAPFARTIALMQRYLAEAHVGLIELEKLAARHGVLDPMRTEISASEAVELAREIRVLMRTLGFEGTAMLVEAMLLAGDPMLARVCGIELQRPKKERSQ